ncbi:Iron-only hydrogenase [Carpediemonas membranifera]|uniref:Iron-only hydrogenase n=1 Tax=Carpediemonas membranifera TaxID=201153 RepID=A0A8J6E5S2_9EUKA|nr:Iron-only hydrogenase [Carpediemonas membranifera]|eukprot:KAG9396217.1 Iron-only hydrogenase [Carpediemonas membranifera]
MLSALTQSFTASTLFSRTLSAMMTDASSNSIMRDYAKCIFCDRCVDACESQSLNVYEESDEPEPPITVGNVPLKETNCISCGQCAVVCPVDCLYEKDASKTVLETLKNKNGKICVAVTAPSVRVGISEEAGLPAGTDSTGQMVAALKAFGFDYVFDTNTAADLTIMEEGTELLSRLGQGTMFTSCCPGWVNMAEKVYPELIPNLSSCRSPQGMAGSLVRHKFSQVLGVKPEDIYLVSFMPCTAKKDEIKREQLSDDIDEVCTVREFGRMLTADKVDLKALPAADFDEFFGESTGGADIFGASGGVMEAALRFAHEAVTGKPAPNVEFDGAVRPGKAGIKEATVALDGKELKVAVVSGGDNIAKLIKRIKAGEKFDFVEVMACPGGCVGGGGMPKGKAFKKNVPKRAEGLYSIDRSKGHRKSQENDTLHRLYASMLGGAPGSHEAHELLHTTYRTQN